MNIIVCKSHYEVHLSANHTLNGISLKSSNATTD